MNYQETIEFLYSKLPMFSRIGESAIKKDLTNTLALSHRLGNPHTQFRSIHIAGTNGKGSVSHMLASVLQSAGYKTGLYTSPHLRDFRERIKINGQMIPEEAVIRFVKTQMHTIEEVQPSFFEVTVAMAFNYFSEQLVDIAVIETGLGGRLDSTNVITPELSIITNIGYDHMNILGSTLPEIAAEKAGIIKDEVPVVVSEEQQEVSGVFRLKAKEKHANLHFASAEWKEQYHEANLKAGQRKVVLSSLSNPERSMELTLDLTGSYQLKNVKAVLSAVGILRPKGFEISDSAVKEGLSAVKNKTGLMGRWQTLGTEPLVICDTGHNEDGIKEVLKNIRSVAYNRLHLVLGMVKDKEVSKILSLLPRDAFYYFTQPAIERAKPASELAKEAAEAGLNGEVFQTVKQALEAAKKNAAKDDLIFVGGSTFVVAEVV